ncbi:hypothetical protein Aros01_01417 [Streptosporangium roseum]|uniref:Uncharacterized protein n=1 Tax=Streptosporangium roseum (strain ATCC 12428 / DSM 43021 / JCM 3005 / KCTC 9067 / NCIMB 10171 / NRRL 2505 / NI 9100) TaxID=479432 RepID=D2B199_STRRD|nr:hypothetical protein Sros_2384 [Streptosporangium roseum DSM 43021]
MRRVTEEAPMPRVPEEEPMRKVTFRPTAAASHRRRGR